MSHPDRAAKPEAPVGAADPARTPGTWAGLISGRPDELVLPGALEQVRAAHLASGRHVVVLDDDPTGSQAVHDVPVLTRWDDDDLRWAFAHPGRAFFVLTNTRSLEASAAAALLVDLDARIARVAADLGADVVLVSRGDSTLRGHFPLETDVLRRAAADRGVTVDAVVLAPAYLDAGRVTADDVHYARSGEVVQPVGRTDYARDEAFGYTSSDLRDWVEEKTGGAVAADDVLSISIDDVRLGGVERVRALLLQARGGTVVVVNLLAAADLDVVALALAQAEQTGWRPVYRVGPSLVAARVGIGPSAPLTSSQVLGPRTPASPRHGLVVVGSHVDLTTRQVRHLVDLPGTGVVELDVRALTQPDTAAQEVARCTQAVLATAATADVVLMTSRERVVTATGQSSLALSRAVSAALVELTRRLRASVGLAWVVAKGGITSHDIATDGLGVRRATVLGQLFPGQVSVWRTESDSSDGAPPVGLPYVVFAGNVGDEHSLRDAVLTLRGERVA